MADNSRQDNENPINKLLDSIDNLLCDEKERKLRAKLGNKIKDCIFTDEIVTMLNEGDFSGLTDEQEEIVFLFSMLFPVVVNEENTIFRLYRHKIEVGLSNESRDRYIYIFSDGRLTSGLFESFRLYDNVYVNVIKRIINVFPSLKNAINDSYIDFKENGINHKEKIQHYRDKEIVAEKNFNDLILLLEKKSDL